MKNQRDLIGAAHIEVIPDHTFKPHPPSGWPVEYAGVSNLELTGRHLISVPSPDIGLGKRRGKTSPPTSEKALHRTWAEPITDLLQRGSIAATTEPII